MLRFLSFSNLVRNNLSLYYKVDYRNQIIVTFQLFALEEANFKIYS